jgi:hypothetical protein
MSGAQSMKQRKHFARCFLSIDTAFSETLATSEIAGTHVAESVGALTGNRRAMAIRANAATNPMANAPAMPTRS